MSTAGAALLCAITGGVFELAGLSLIVREIAADRAHARQLFKAPEVYRSPRRPHYGRAPRTGYRPSPFSGLAGTSPQPRAIVEHMLRSEAALANALIAVREAVDSERDQLEQALRKKLSENDAEIRANLHYVLAGSARDRVVGTALLGIGIILATAGTVLSSLS